MYFEEKHSRQHYTTMLHYQDMHSLPHCQSTAEILFVRHGTVQASCREQTLLLHSGQCILVMPYEVHAYETLESNDTAVYIFSADLMPDFFQYTETKQLLQPVIPFLDHQLEILSDEAQGPFMKKSILYALASDALRGGLVQTESQSNQQPMSQMMLYIQAHYQESISLHSLAQHLGYSYNYASHLFRQYFHTGFCEIVNQYRLEKAAQLLRDSPLSITQVADQAGFSTIRSFNQVFKQVYQVSPSRYREQLTGSL